MQIHACLLALRTGRPVKMVYGREESFFGHVHRHPATLRYEHGADRDGGWSTSRRRSSWTAARTRRHPGRGRQRGLARRRPVRGAQRRDRLLRRLHQQPAVRRDARLRRRAGLLRLRVPDGQAGRGARAGPGRAPRPQRACARARVLPTGQVVDSPAPLAEHAAAGAAGRSRCRPPPTTARPAQPAGRRLQHHARRGRACAASGTRVGIKNICFSEGFDDYSTARVRLELAGGEPLALVHTAAAEVGQGLVTVQAQIARTELGVRAGRRRARRHHGRLGRLLSASRQTLHDRRRGPRRLRGAYAKRVCASPGSPGATLTGGGTSSPGRRRGRAGRGARRTPSRRPGVAPPADRARWTR